MIRKGPGGAVKMSRCEAEKRWADSAKRWVVQRREGWCNGNSILSGFPLHILPYSGLTCNGTELIFRSRCNLRPISRKKATGSENFLFSVAHSPISARKAHRITSLFPVSLHLTRFCPEPASRPAFPARHSAQHLSPTSHPAQSAGDHRLRSRNYPRCAPEPSRPCLPA